MTTGRFCAQCGKEAGGGAFCQQCGAAQAVAPAAATPPTPPIRSDFCPNCGTKAEAGLAFCTKCGANLATGVPLAPSQYVRPAARQSQMPIYLGGAAVVIALIVAVMILSGGDDEKTPASAASGGQTPAVAATAAAGGGNNASAAATPRVATQPRPKPYTPPNTPDAAVGLANEEAAEDIAKSLQRAGLDLRGTSVSVFHINGTDQQLLVFTVDTATATAMSNALSTTANQRNFAKAVVDTPVVKKAKISRIAMDLTGRDAQGRYTVSMTMTMATLEAMAKGTLSDTELQQQIQTKGSRR